MSFIRDMFRRSRQRLNGEIRWGPQSMDFFRRGFPQEYMAPGPPRKYPVQTIRDFQPQLPPTVPVPPPVAPPGPPPPPGSSSTTTTTSSTTSTTSTEPSTTTSTSTSTTTTSTTGSSPGTSSTTTSTTSTTTGPPDDRFVQFERCNVGGCGGSSGNVFVFVWEDSPCLNKVVESDGWCWKRDPDAPFITRDELNLIIAADPFNVYRLIQGGTCPYALCEIAAVAPGSPCEPRYKCFEPCNPNSSTGRRVCYCEDFVDELENCLFVRYQGECFLVNKTDGVDATPSTLLTGDGVNPEVQPERYEDCCECQTGLAGGCGRNSSNYSCRPTVGDTVNEDQACCGLPPFPDEWGSNTVLTIITAASGSHEYNTSGRVVVGDIPGCTLPAQDADVCGLTQYKKRSFTASSWSGTNIFTVTGNSSGNPTFTLVKSSSAFVNEEELDRQDDDPGYTGPCPGNTTGALVPEDNCPDSTTFSETFSGDYQQGQSGGDGPTVSQALEGATCGIDGTGGLEGWGRSIQQDSDTGNQCNSTRWGGSFGEVTCTQNGARIEGSQIVRFGSETYRACTDDGAQQLPNPYFNEISSRQEFLGLYNCKGCYVGSAGVTASSPGRFTGQRLFQTYDVPNNLNSIPGEGACSELCGPPELITDNRSSMTVQVSVNVNSPCNRGKTCPTPANP